MYVIVEILLLLSWPPYPLQRRLQLYSASAAVPSEALPNGAESGAAAAAAPGGAKTGMEKLKGYPAAVYKFTRPHTIRGEVCRAHVPALSGPAFL